MLHHIHQISFSPPPNHSVSNGPASMEEMKSIARLGLAVAGGGWRRRREGDNRVVSCVAVSPLVEVNGLEGTVENRIDRTSLSKGSMIERRIDDHQDLDDGDDGDGDHAVVMQMDEVDAKAEEFIKKFKQVLRLEKQKSVEEYYAKLARGT
ncbi:hypothetical protein LWI29_031218 [Acer saccharum]|uniref:Uncharacterized protein n=1 Tax=Acer saccharum TaxID=4024 RepID=A0AA39T6S0_ACESA|nr:hypothetical protein LWI29_031218 [Acer saccharum]